MKHPNPSSGGTGTPEKWILDGPMVAYTCILVGFRGEGLVTAIAVARAESGFDAWVENHAGDDTKWGPAVGLFQVRCLKDPSGSAQDRKRSVALMKSPRENAQFAYDLSRGGKVWEPMWSAHTNGSYKKFLAQAREWAGNPAMDLPPQQGGPNSDTARAAAGVAPVANDWIDEDRDPLPVNIGADAKRGELGNRIVAASVEYSMAEASLSRFELEDQTAGLLRQQKIREGTALSVAGRRQIITKVGAKQGPGSPHLILEAQPAGVVRLRGVTPSKRSTTAVKYARALAKAAGMPFAGGPPSPRIDIEAQDVDLGGTATTQQLDPSTGLAHGTRKENAWELLRRLAKESTGYICFESGGTLYYATQDWLYDNAGVVYVQVGNAKFTTPRGGVAIRAVGYPDITRSIKRDAQNQDYRHAEVSVNLPPGRGYNALPGKRLWLAEPSGIIEDARPMLITRCSISGGDRTALVRVQAASYSAPGDTDATPPSTTHDTSGYGSITTDGQTTGGGRSGMQAVDWAKNQAAEKTTGWDHRCDNFVAQCYGHAHSGSETAAIHWARIPKGKKHPGDRAAPIGALLFYSPNHVALFCGRGKLASTDFPVKDRIGISPVGDIEFHWGVHYLGWSEPWFG